MNKFKAIVISLMLGWIISLGMFPEDSKTIVSKAEALSGRCVPTLKTGTLLKLKVKVENDGAFTTIRSIGTTCEELLQRIMSEEKILVMYTKYESGDIKAVQVSINKGRTYWNFDGEINYSEIKH
ncbi:hypothetical protein U2G59_003629 [Vibrio alginolyticus]|nr:hypothetical protein [Vibrio alginolyticus]